METISTQSPTDLKMWKPIQSFVANNPDFTENQMNWLLRHRKENGIDSVTRKIGKRIYINEILFAEWVMNHE